MSPPNFIEAEGRDGGDTWVRKASAGQVVSLGERRAFVGQVLGIMDVLARPGAVLTAGGVVPPTLTYRGPNAVWNGRAVPLLGSLNPPAEWLVKPPRRAAGEVGGAAKVFDLQRLLEPTLDERRRYWLALHDTVKSLSGGFEVVPDPSPRTAGVLPVAAVVVIAVAAIGALATAITYAVHTAVRESAETARHAADLEAAAREYVQRLQYKATHPDQPMPEPGPAEVRVRTPPPSAPSGTPSPLDDAANRALSELVATGGRVVLVGGGLVLAATVLPPILANIADRATRERREGSRHVA